MKELVFHYNLTVTRKSRSWQAFRQGVSAGPCRVYREDKLDKTSKGKFPDIVATMWGRTKKKTASRKRDNCYPRLWPFFNSAPNKLGL
jgi:hypothetical protein